MDWWDGLVGLIGGKDWRDGLEGWIGGMDWKDGLEGWIGGMDWRDGLEGRLGGKDWRDGLEGWIGGMDQRDGLERWSADWSEGWTEKRMEGCCIVVLILFSQKAKYSYFRRKSIFANSKIFAFSWAIFAKNENYFRQYFRENVAKIYSVPDYHQPVQAQFIS
jgi:hypothetical protein